ncbi:hypothetical protein [Streptomyces sp. NPDC097619]|uniref:hypothetical protein n=1 Tax=Streptomyces sp. NPDC097619 TaxID=3157228 RepID=UPI003319E1C4
MSLHDELNAVLHRLDDLAAKVERLERAAAAAPPARPPAGAPPGMVTVPETPYDGALWTDADDEGLGRPPGPARPGPRGRRAP